MNKAGKSIEEDSPVMEGLKNELDDLIEPFQLSLVIYGGKIMYLDIFSYSMFPFGKSCCWSQQKILWGECLSVIAIKCDCRYSCYRPLLLYQAVKCLGWQRQLSNNFSTDFKWGSPRSCEVTGRSMLRGTMPPVAEKLSFQPCWHDLLLLCHEEHPQLCSLGKGKHRTVYVRDAQ